MRRASTGRQSTAKNAFVRTCASQTDSWRQQDTYSTRMRELFPMTSSASASWERGQRQRARLKLFAVSSDVMRWGSYTDRQGRIRSSVIWCCVGLGKVSCSGQYAILSRRSTGWHCSALRHSRAGDYAGVVSCSERERESVERGEVGILGVSTTEASVRPTTCLSPLRSRSCEQKRGTTARAIGEVRRNGGARRIT